MNKYEYTPINRTREADRMKRRIEQVTKAISRNYPGWCQRSNMVKEYETAMERLADEQD